MNNHWIIVVRAGGVCVCVCVCVCAMVTRNLTPMLAHYVGVFRLLLGHGGRVAVAAAIAGAPGPGLGGSKR